MLLEFSICAFFFFTLTIHGFRENRCQQMPLQEGPTNLKIVVNTAMSR